MGKLIVFQTREEEYVETGRVPIGYLIDREPTKVFIPNVCIECDKWFGKGEEAHEVIYQYVFHTIDGHVVAVAPVGFLCKKCFENAMSQGKFRGGKMRKKTNKEADTS